MGEEMFTMKIEVVGQLRSVGQKIGERQHFTIFEVLYEFSWISCTFLYEIMTVRLGCNKFYARCVPKMLVGAHKTRRMAFSLTF
jgi:hypothetical protein